jgi:hypothetical protein
MNGCSGEEATATLKDASNGNDEKIRELLVRRKGLKQDDKKEKMIITGIYLSGEMHWL